MARVADYRTLTDNFFRLNTKLENFQPNTSQEFSFNMPARFHAGSRAILHFMVQLSKNSDIEYRIHLNGQTTEFHHRWGGHAIFQAMHEIIAPNRLRQNNNTLQFQLDNSVKDNNLIDIGDVYILCQVETD